MDEIYKIIDGTLYISNLQKDFYKTSIGKRYELILTPAFGQLQIIEEIQDNTMQIKL